MTDLERELADALRELLASEQDSNSQRRRIARTTAKAVLAKATGRDVKPWPS